MSFSPYTRSRGLGQPPYVLAETQSVDLPPEWLRWLRHGMDVLSGRAQLQMPQVIIGEEPPTPVELLKNPLVWIGLAALTVALFKK